MARKQVTRRCEEPLEQSRVIVRTFREFNLAAEERRQGGVVGISEGGRGDSTKTESPGWRLEVEET